MTSIKLVSGVYKTVSSAKVIYKWPCVLRTFYNCFIISGCSATLSTCLNRGPSWTRPPVMRKCVDVWLHSSNVCAYSVQLVTLLPHVLNSQSECREVQWRGTRVWPRGRIANEVVSVHLTVFLVSDIKNITFVLCIDVLCVCRFLWLDICQSNIYFSWHYCSYPCAPAVCLNQVACIACTCVVWYDIWPCACNTEDFWRTNNFMCLLLT